MKKAIKVAFLGFVLLVLISCNIPGSETDRKEQEYNYKLDQQLQEVAATEGAQKQTDLEAPDSSNDTTADTQNGPINTEVPAESDASGLKMVYEGTGTVINYYWGVEDIENSCPSGAKVTLTVEGDTCTANFIYPAMAMGTDKVCSPYADDNYLVTGPYSSVDGLCTFNTIAAPNIAGGSVNGGGAIMGAAKVEFWIQNSNVTDSVRHYYSDYLAQQP